MNEQRREKIRQLKVKFHEVQTELKQLSGELSSILNEEHDAFDNMPEGLQSSYKFVAKTHRLAYGMKATYIFYLSFT